MLQLLDHQSVGWLLASSNPSIRFQAQRDLVEEPEDGHTLRNVQAMIPRSPFAESLLHGLQVDGGFGVPPYTKWTGAHWRLVSLAELAFPSGDPRIAKMANHALEWLQGNKHLDQIRRVNGKVRAHASMEGNGLVYCSKLGLAEDPRVKALADSLAEWQWPDGGWNCDPRIDTHHSSFNESLIPLRGLIEYQRSSGQQDYRDTVERATEFFLKHQLYKSCTTGQLVNTEWLELRFPAYWHYNMLDGLLTMSMVGKMSDPRARDAIDNIVGKRRSDGKWSADGFYWLMPGETGKKSAEFSEDYSEPPQPEVVDWGREGPNELLTLKCLRVLKSASSA